MAVCAHGLPFLLEEGMKVVLVPPALKGPREFVVRSLTGGGSGTLMSLAGIESLGQASKLVGKGVLARVADLPADYALHDVDALLGTEVRDVSRGLLGTICEVMRTPAQDVWVVRNEDREVLIPAVEPIVVSWNLGEPIVVQTPEGLIEDVPDQEGGEERQ